MNIVLLGYRGTGKSVVSKKLSHKLRRRLYKIDDLISESAGKSIPEIDCGGGVVLNDANIENLKKDGVCIVLTANLETIIKRIKHDQNRPPLEVGLSFEEEQKIIIEEREGKYRAAADFICNTSNRRPVETVEEITEFLKTKGWI